MTVHNHGIDPTCEETRTPDGLRGDCILHETIRDQAAIRASWDGDCPDVTRIVRRVGAALNSGRDAAVVEVVLDETAKARTEVDELRAEVERLRRNRPYCNVMDGPDETCSRHGRTYDEWVERGDILQTRAQNAEAEADTLRIQLAAIRALVAPQWRSIFYDRNALIDDIRAALGES